MKKAKANGIELNARGIPARKRKKNSLIYGADDLVSISVILSNRPLKEDKIRFDKTSYLISSGEHPS